MKGLIKKLIDGVASRDYSGADDFDNTIVYYIETDELRLILWNSSNRGGFDHKYVLRQIACELLDNEDCMSGSISDDFNEIMFEIKEK